MAAVNRRDGSEADMNPLERVARTLDALNETVGRTVAWLTVIMVIAYFTVVVLRYLFDVGSIAFQESVTYMHAFVFMLGAAYTLKHDGHVRVDVLYRRFGLRGQAVVDLFGALGLLLPVSIFILWSSWETVTVSWQRWEGSDETGGLPFVYVLRTVIPVMAVLMILQGISQIARCLLILSGNEAAGPEHDAAREI